MDFDYIWYLSLVEVATPPNTDTSKSDEATSTHTTRRAESTLTDRSGLRRRGCVLHASGLTRAPVGRSAMPEREPLLLWSRTLAGRFGEKGVEHGSVFLSLSLLRQKVSPSAVEV